MLWSKAPVEPFQFVRNGKYPDALLQAELTDSANHCALYRIKQLAAFGSYTQNVPAGTYGDIERPRWRFRWVSSPYATAVVFKVWMAQAPTEGGGSRPRCRLRIANDAGTTQGDAEIGFGAAATSASTPDVLGFSHTYVIEDGGTDVWTPTANTEYQATISDFDNARIVAATIYEAPYNTTAPFPKGYAVTTPILDTHRELIAAGSRQMWKTGAAPCFHWTVDDAGSPRTRTSATPINVIDNTSTTVSTATPGHTIDLRNRNRASATTVPVKLWVYAGMSADEGEVSLRDSTGSSVASIAISGAAGWSSATANLPATLAKYDIWMASNGTDTISVYHASLIQFSS